MSKQSTDKTENKNSKSYDPLAIAYTLADVYQHSIPAIKDFLENYNTDAHAASFDPLNISKTYIDFLDNLAKDPEKLWEIQTEYWQKHMALWQKSSKKFLGEISQPEIKPEKGDRRFQADEWKDNAVFDFIKQSYLLTCDWMDKVVRNDTDIPPEKQKQLAFYTKLFADAMSPTNFIMTNPEVLKETLDTGGENLVRGLKNLLEDLKRGGGELKISTTDYDAFEVGKNLAITPGQVVYQNDLIQLIQYTPCTEKVFKTPLLIIPPWINKFYILDLRPDKSLIEWAVAQGHTVFVISWANPTQSLAKKRFEDYMSEGILDALKQIEKSTGEKQSNAIGYCLGGTLLATTLAYLKKKKQDNRIKSATFLTTLLDFEKAGDMRLFLDDDQMALLDKKMAETGVLEAKTLQQTFSLLRSNDLIWSFVINNYLMGREPFPFDLLYWNDDSTNMPAAMHSFYLRKMYRDNALIQPGGISMNDTSIDLSLIDTPSYFLSAREDHIAPWQATYAGTQIFSGPKMFTLATSGHIAGVANSPVKNKYSYWTSEKTPSDPKDWLKDTKEHTGSWWPHWQKWIEAFADKQVPARNIKNPLEPAPGSYVKVKFS